MAPKCLLLRREFDVAANRLFITGYADLKALRDVGEDRIIQKPFRDDELSRKIDAVLGVVASDSKVVPLRR